MKFRTTMAIAVLVAPALGLAQEPEKTSPWAGKATLGYLATSGARLEERAESLGT